MFIYETVLQAYACTRNSDNESGNKEEKSENGDGDDDSQQVNPFEVVVTSLESYTPLSLDIHQVRMYLFSNTSTTYNCCMHTHTG